MAVLSLQRIVTQLRRVVLAGDGSTDGQLLAQFISQQDETAFEALVKRHGPMVLGVCRRLLGNVHDADDAFQATFLILVHKAASLRSGERLGNWLYGVACNTALAVRAKNSRRRAKEKQVTEMPEPAATPPDDWSELRPLLDQELRRLGDAYREAIVLCDLEGKTRKEAAQELGIPESTLSGRLTSARRQLAKRLARLGLALSGGAVAAALSPGTASACVPGSLVASTVKAAAAVAAGSATADVVSASVVALTEGVLKTMSMTKVKTLTAVVVALFVAAGVALVGHALAASAPTQDQPAGKEQQKRQPKKDDRKAEPKKEEAKEEAKKADLQVKKIVVVGSGNVTFQQGKKNTLNGAALTAGDLEDGVLQLMGDKDAVIELEELPEVVLAGTGNFTGKGVKARRAAFVINGSKNVIRLSGTADEQVVTINGSAKFEGRELKGKQATISVNGPGDVIVNVTDGLKASVAGPGSVRYLGSPKVEKSVFGGGKVSADKDGDEPQVKPAPKADATLEKIRKLEAELKQLQEELKKLKKE
jgi:RNA polymerase sigma factor (sigma-70 family)